MALAATWLPAIIFAGAGFIAAIRWLPRDKFGPRLATFDALTLTLWSMGMLALVYGIVAIVGGWGTGFWVAGLVGVVLVGWAAVRLSRRAGSRIHPPDVPFRVIGVALITGAIIALAQSGTLLQLSNFLKGVQGYGPLQSGLAFLPFGAATLVAALTTGVLLGNRLGAGPATLKTYRMPIAAGLLTLALAIASFATFRADTSYLFIGTALVVLGIGASVANVPRTALLFSSIERGRIGVAAGLNASCVVLGGALGNIAVTAMISLTTADSYRQVLIDAGMSPEQAAATFADLQYRIFVLTAPPFTGPVYIDVVKRLPGWADAVHAGVRHRHARHRRGGRGRCGNSWLALRAGALPGAPPLMSGGPAASPSQEP